MMQTSTFRHAKSMARYPLGYAGEAAFQYWSDTRRQWEESNDSRKILGLIGSQNSPRYRRADLRKAVGQMSDDEIKLGRQFEAFYASVPTMMTSLPCEVDIEGDWLETVLDMRQLRPHLNSARRILDIGPGAGRHMAAFALAGNLATRNYTGLECIGLPYALQDFLGRRLATEGRVGKYQEFLDYQFARIPFSSDQGVADNTITHLPLWEADQIPAGSVDLILCCYVLDEVSPDDYLRLVKTIDRVLAPGGVVYCRGSQERALHTNFNQYGYGHRHGQDITQSLRSIGLVADRCDLIADTVTRTFVRQGVLPAAPKEPFALHASDATLVPALTGAFNESLIDELSSSKARVVIWGEPGYQRHQDELKMFLERTNVVGFTSRAAKERSTLANGREEFPVSELPSLAPDVVVFLSHRFASFYRELSELMPAGSYSRVRHFLLPVAAAFR